MMRWKYIWCLILVSGWLLDQKDELIVLILTLEICILKVYSGNLDSVSCYEKETV